MRRPVTTTRVPRVSDSAAFSASARQQLTVKNDVSPSVQLPAASRIRVEYATRKFATAAPLERVAELRVIREVPDDGDLVVARHGAFPLLSFAHASTEAGEAAAFDFSGKSRTL